MSIEQWTRLLDLAERLVILAEKRFLPEEFHQDAEVFKQGEGEPAETPAEYRALPHEGPGRFSEFVSNANKPR